MADSNRPTSGDQDGQHDLLDLLRSFFKGRSDAFGLQANGSILTARRPLTDEDLIGHIRGTHRVGVFPLLPNGTTSWLAFDLDRHTLFDAAQLLQRCGHFGLTGLIERSRRRGYHVLIFFNTPVLAWKARAVARMILEEVELHCEIFPKQARVHENGLGNFLFLPFHGGSVQEERTLFLDPTTGSPYADQLAALRNSPKVQTAWLDEIVELNNLHGERSFASAGFTFEEIPDALPLRFGHLLQTDPKVRATWDGKHTDLADQSRSGYDMAMAGLLAARGFSPEEIAAVLRQMPSGRGADATPDYLAHTISKTFADPGGAETDEQADPQETCGAARAEDDRRSASQQGGQATLLIRLCEESGAVLFHDQFNVAFAWAPTQDGHAVLKVRSQACRSWLVYLLWTKHQKAPSSEALQSALTTLEARARFDGRQHPLFNRVAWHDGAIWYDLGQAAVKITAAGWTIIGQPPILFRRYAHQCQQDFPQPGGDLTAVLQFVNLPGSHAGLSTTQLLFLVTLVTMLTPDSPHPLLCVQGEQGSGKTTFSKIIRELIDPSVIATFAPPENLREFVQLASHHRVVMLDNLSGLPDWLSDALSRCVTGEGFSKRELYSDDDDVLYSFKLCVGVNGINLVVSKPDLLDRALIVSLDRIPDTKRRTEKEFWADFHAEKSSLLGALFMTLSRAMAEVEHVTAPEYPRMADFARWGTAVARALGFTDHDFLQALAENVDIQTTEALESSPVAQAHLKFMDGKAKWDGSSKTLLTELNTVAPEAGVDPKHKRWPKDATWVWRRIKEVRPNLLRAGWRAERDRNGTTRIRITRA